MKQVIPRGKNRYNLDDHFEDVYLRSRTLRRFMDKVDNDVMKSKDTFKVIEHLTDRQMAVYGRIFNWNGFDRDDIRSIVSVFAACFTGLGVKKKSKRDYYYLMMSFVNQRMEFFTGCVIRKFQVNDVACYNVLSSTGVSQDVDNENPNSALDILTSLDQIAHFSSGQPETENPSYSEQADDMEDRVEILKIQHAMAVQELQHPDKVTELGRTIERLTATAQSYREEANKDKKKDRLLNAALKQKLAEDPLKYSDQLSYYATYKGIPYDVRRAAQVVCKRHGIDYVAWAKERAKSYGSDDSYFDLR